MTFNLMEKNARLNIEAKIGTMEKLLQDAYEGYSKIIKPETLEVNIGKDRTEVDMVGTTEAQLKSRQVGSKVAVTEQKLETEKGMYNKLRNTVSSDTPLLEKKRLDNNPTEREVAKKANK